MALADLVRLSSGRPLRFALASSELTAPFRYTVPAMRTRLHRLVVVALGALLIGACTGPEPAPTLDIQATVQAAVEATVVAQPTPTPDIQAMVQAAVEAAVSALETPEPLTEPGSTRTPGPLDAQPTAIPTPTPTPGVLAPLARERGVAVNFGEGVDRGRWDLVGPVDYGLVDEFLGGVFLTNPLNGQLGYLFSKQLINTQWFN